MARPWRAGGDGRAVSFPELPWKKETPIEHQTEVHQSGADMMVSVARQYYFACDTCGACGTMQTVPEDAEIEAASHRKWARLNGPGEVTYGTDTST